jgi:hypothetical protein
MKSSEILAQGTVSYRKIKNPMHWISNISYKPTCDNSSHCLHGMACPWVVDGGDGLQILRLAWNTRTICKVRGLISLLRVETLWRCGDGPLFRSTSIGKRLTSYNAPPTSRKRAADHWSLRNFLTLSSRFVDGKAQKSHGARFVLNSMFGLEK